jgi:hypothetical protein
VVFPHPLPIHGHSMQLNDKASPHPAALSLSSLFLLGDDMARALQRLSIACSAAGPWCSGLHQQPAAPAVGLEPPHLSRPMRRTLSTFGRASDRAAAVPGPGLPSRSASETLFSAAGAGDGGGVGVGRAGWPREGAAAVWNGDDQPLQSAPPSAPSSPSRDAPPWSGGGRLPTTARPGDYAQPSTGLEGQTWGRDGEAGAGPGLAVAGSMGDRAPVPAPVSWTVPFPMRWRPRAAAAAEDGQGALAGSSGGRRVPRVDR